MVEVNTQQNKMQLMVKESKTRCSMGARIHVLSWTASTAQQEPSQILGRTTGARNGEHGTGSTERGARNGEHGKFLDRVQQTNPTMSTYQIFIFDYIAVCINIADLAQSVQRAPFKRVAVGSIPTVGIISLKLPCYKVSIHTYSERVSSILAAENKIIIY